MLADVHLRELPVAELHLLDAGHWALEPAWTRSPSSIGTFLFRVHS